MKRIIVAIALAAAGAALAQTVSSPSGTGDVSGIVNADAGPSQASSADGGASAARSAAQTAGTPGPVYSFDPPSVGQYSFSITSR
jgi:hypothetical protein